VVALNGRMSVLAVSAFEAASGASGANRQSARLAPKRTDLRMSIPVETRVVGQDTQGQQPYQPLVHFLHSYGLGRRMRFTAFID